METFRKWRHLIWYESIRSLLRLVFFPLFRISVKGRKNVPRKGPVLILSNHQSFFDPMYCQLPINRHMHYIARSTLYDNKFFGWLLLTLNTIPIKQGEADISAMKKAINVLKEGKMLCLYPEGSRTHDGKIAEIQGGFGLLSRRSKATVVPVVIDGAYECWPRQNKWPKIGKVYVEYGKPFTPEEIKELGDEEFSRLFNERLRTMQNQMRVRNGKQPFDYTEITND